MDTLFNQLIDWSECKCNELITYEITEIKTLVSVYKEIQLLALLLCLF